MAAPAIKVEGLSKRYRIAARRKGRRSLPDVLADTLAAPARRLLSFGRSSHREEDAIWALKDISFEVQPGEVLGIIGPNGAGKSTLLKILSRITSPTSGYAELKGRVSSLLEVGTGFHEELTGRENVYLSGAILGMRKREIDADFDRIVEFAGVEKFIDTPVKRYSSGMRVRLGFAVAAHLRPEILLVDEVLAVGDLSFQRRCLGRMGEIGRTGRTVLFVSHNTQAVGRLCSKVLWLEEGGIRAFGRASDVIAHYEESQLAGLGCQAEGAFLNGVEADGSPCSLRRVEMLDTDGRPLRLLRTGEEVTFRMHYDCREEVREAGFVLDFETMLGERILRLSSYPLGGQPIDLKPGRGHVDCHVGWFPLAAGTFALHGGISAAGTRWVWPRRALGRLSVGTRDVYASRQPPTAPTTYIALEHTWHHFRDAGPARGDA